MAQVDEIRALLEEAVREFERRVRLELERIGLGFSRWLADLLPRMPCDYWRDELDRVIANLARDQVFVDGPSRDAMIAWLENANQAAKARGQQPSGPAPPRFPTREQIVRPPDVRDFPDDLPSPFDPAYPQLRRAGNSIMQQYPPAEWLQRAIALLKNYCVPDEMRATFLRWIESEQRKIVLTSISPAAKTVTGPADDPLYAICFASGTQVLTRRGQVAIELVTADDEVWAVPEDDSLAAAGWCRVQRALHNAPAELIDIRPADHAVIRVTLNHPIYVREKGFIAAQCLRPGDLLRAADDRWVPIAETVRRGHVEPVFNLCVADSHTYFAGGVLVHNQSPATPAPGTSPVVEPPTLSKPDQDAFNRWKRALNERQRRDFEEFEKQRATSPDSTTGILYYKADTRAAYLYASVAVVGAELLVTLRKGSPKFPGGNFRQVVTGSSGDRDSTQVAVQWRPGGQTVTNVISGGDRPKANAAARWEVDDDLTGRGTVYGKAVARFDVPAGATEVKVVLIYTDLIDANRRDQDAAGVIASWTGKKNGAQWDFKPNASEIMPWYGNKPDAAAVQKIQGETEAVLQGMGLRLVYRARHFPSDVNTGYDISK